MTKSKALRDHKKLVTHDAYQARSMDLYRSRIGVQYCSICLGFHCHAIPNMAFHTALWSICFCRIILHVLVFLVAAK